MALEAVLRGAPPPPGGEPERGTRGNAGRASASRSSKSVAQPSATAARLGVSEGGNAAVVGKHRPRARQAAGAGGRADRRGAVAPAVDAADVAVLAAGGAVRGQGTRDETAAVLHLEPGAGRRQRRPQLRSGTADDGRPAQLLRQARRAAEAAAEADAIGGRRSIPSPTPPAAPAVPAAGGSGASARRAARAGPPGVGARPGRRASCGPEAAEPAGRERRRSVGMGRAAPAGSGTAGLPARVA